MGYYVYLSSVLISIVLVLACVGDESGEQQWRFGVGVATQNMVDGSTTTNLDDFEGYRSGDEPWNPLGLGWYFNWNWRHGVVSDPLTGQSVEYMPLVGGWRPGVHPSLAEIEARVNAAPELFPDGTTWLIGNEIIWDDQRTPLQYARDYHEFYYGLKAINSTFKVANGSIITSVYYDKPGFTGTPYELLDAIREAYQSEYGQDWPVDVWNIHPYVWAKPTVQEELVDFENQLNTFRNYMASIGEQDKPLIITEYGLLNYHPQQWMIEYMLGSFKILLSKNHPNGMPSDEGRWVQRWAWFVNNNHVWYEGGPVQWTHCALYNGDTFDIRPLGQAYAVYPKSDNPYGVSGANWSSNGVMMKLGMPSGCLCYIWDTLQPTNIVNMVRPKKYWEYVGVNPDRIQGYDSETDELLHPEEFGQWVEEHPGRIWIIGNEPDMGGQDNLTPAQYARMFHTYYEFISTRDATARFATAGLGALADSSWLNDDITWWEQALGEYRSQFGTDMPIDIWNCHCYAIAGKLDPNRVIDDYFRPFLEYTRRVNGGIYAYTEFWVTEFGLGGVGPELGSEYMKQICPRLEAMGVDRFFWFIGPWPGGWDPGFNDVALLGPDGLPTVLGQTYNQLADNYPNPIPPPSPSQEPFPPAPFWVTSDFEVDSSPWRVMLGDWSVDGGAYRQRRVKGAACWTSSYLPYEYQNLRVDLDVRINAAEQPQNWAGITLRGGWIWDDGDTKTYLVYIRQNGEVGLWTQADGTVASVPNAVSDTSEYHHLRVILVNSYFEVSVDGTLVLTWNDPHDRRTFGLVALRTCKADCSFDNVEVVAHIQTEPAPFTRDGEPFFPIGLYHCPRTDGTDPVVLEEIGEAGFNCLRVPISSVSRELLDRAQTYGVGILAAAGSWLGNPDSYGDELEAKVNEIKDHPALLGYETYDEPYWNYYHYGRGYSRENLTAGRELLNSLDPNHLVWCNFAPYDLTTTADYRPLTFKGYVEWTSVGNIFGMDRYPVWDDDYPNEDLNPVNFDCDMLKQIAYEGAGEGTTIYMVLQGVGMLEWDDDPNNDGRRPNYTETRFMGYSSIIHGAKGILYWGPYYIEPDSQFWAELKQFAGELDYLQDVLSKGVTETDFSIADEHCEGLLKVYENRHYLIVANPTSTPKNEVLISVTNWRSPLTQVLFEGRTINSYEGTLVDSFQPWDVHVYMEVIPGDVENLTTGKKYIFIQLAINDATDGDEIVVGEGIYPENIDFKGKNLILRSTDPQDPAIVAATVINGRGDGSVVSFYSGEGASCVLSGFTITGGDTGIDCSYSSPTIVNCAIVDNEASGIYCYRSNAIIRNCKVMGNGSRGIRPYRSDLTIANCVIAGNGGEGIRCYRSNSSIINCTVTGNDGIGISCRSSGGTMITNSILWDNLPEQITDDSGTILVTYSDVQGSWAGEGNIDADPCFVDADSNDYHLLVDSPCIDAGDPVSEFGLEPEPDGGRINMGAYGNTPEATCKGGLVLQSYNLVSKTRIERTVFDYVYTMTLSNNSTIAVSNVVVELLDASENVTILDEDVSFAYISAGQSATSEDTFSIRVDRSILIDPTIISWRATFEQADGSGAGEVIFATRIDLESIIGDITGEGVVDIDDLLALANDWLKGESVADIAPLPAGDGMVNFLDLAVLAEHWLESTDQ